MKRGVWVRVTVVVVTVLALCVGGLWQFRRAQLEPSSGKTIDSQSRGRVVILVMGFQRDYFDPDGKRPMDRSQALETLAVTNRLLDVAYFTGVEVIHLADQFPPGDWLGNLFRGQAALSGSKGSEIDARVLRKGELPVILHMDRADAFVGSDLGKHLRLTRAAHLVVVGAVAGRGVQTTVEAALNRGYRVTVFEDGVAGRDDGARADALARMRSAGARVGPSKELLPTVRAEAARGGRSLSATHRVP